LQSPEKWDERRYHPPRATQTVGDYMIGPLFAPGEDALHTIEAADPRRPFRKARPPYNLIWGKQYRRQRHALASVATRRAGQNRARFWRKALDRRADAFLSGGTG